MGEYTQVRKQSEGPISGRTATAKPAASVLKEQKNFTETHKITQIFLFIFPESALFYCYTEQEFLNNGGSGVFRGQEGVLNLRNSVLCNKRQQRLPQQHY